jgi:hypothetical protein
MPFHSPGRIANSKSFANTRQSRVERGPSPWHGWFSAVTPNFGGRQPAGVRNLLKSATKALAVLVSEYRRAVVAERHYAQLRRMGARTRAHGGVTSSDFARRVFLEVYCRTPR